MELARELRNSARTRKRISKKITLNKKSNNQIREKLLNEFKFPLVNGRDLKRFRLWEETKNECLYCGQNISGSDMLKGIAEIEHILPKSRSFDNSMNNFILAHRHCNQAKDQATAYDFMKQKGEVEFQNYIQRVNDLYQEGKGSISNRKFENLMCSGQDLSLIHI